MRHPDIPKIPHKLFKWFCDRGLYEELQGDLEEHFIKDHKKYGRRKARRLYAYEVFKMIRPTIFSLPKSGPSLALTLFISYFRLSVRHLSRQKLFSFINIFSLSVAMSAGLLVLGMVNDLLKFDEFHEHKDKIYRVISTPYIQTQLSKGQATSPYSLGQEMMRDIPDLEYTELGRRMGGEANVNDKILPLSGIYADEHFFDFLSFELISGPQDQVLKEPYSIVLTEGFAETTFPDTNPVGQTLQLKDQGTFTITGIVQDPPQFSHIQFQAIVALSTVQDLAQKGVIYDSHDTWENLDRYYHYLYVKDETVLANVEQWLAESAPGFYQSPDEFRAEFELQPINEIIPGPNISDSIGPKMIYLPIIILSVIACAILLSAIFNYTNLSMARSLRRAREVGVRKLNGASGKSVFFQFTLEAIILAVLSLGFGILLFTFLRNEFISLLPRAEQMVSLQLSPKLILWFLGFAILAGLVAGISPSIYFSRLNSINALRSGKMLKTLSGISMRKGLIVAQFTLSIIFIMAVLITNKQYVYSINKDMGFDQENVLNIYLQDNDPQLVKNELMQLSEVRGVSFSSYLAGVGTWNNAQLVDPRNNDTVWVHDLFVDHTFMDNMKVRLVAGRAFKEGENTPKENAVLVNETFVRQFGYNDPVAVVGEIFHIDGENVQVIGVIKDMIYGNLEESVKSFLLRNKPIFNYANVKIQSKDIIATMTRIDEAWNRVDPVHQLQADFHDDHIVGYYKYLVDFMKIFGFIGFLAISISSLGLFGITIYSTEIRKREIGIRKTFGASEWSLVSLLSSGFLRLVFWAIVIGSPICYLIFDQLILAQNFYRVEISLLEVAGSIAIMVSVCLLTVFSQTWSAARTNPSTVLRNE